MIDENEETKPPMHKFCVRPRRGAVREYLTVKDAFDGKGNDDEVWVLVTTNGQYYRVLRP